MANINNGIKSLILETKQEMLNRNIVDSARIDEDYNLIIEKNYHSLLFEVNIFIDNYNRFLTSIETKEENINHLCNKLEKLIQAWDNL